MLGLAEVFESKRNNIVLGYGAGGVKGGVQTAIVFLDPNGTEGQQFRMVAFVGELGRGLHVFSSGDGIQWKLMHQCVVSDRNKRHLDTLNVILWDDRINEYVSYVRRNLCRDRVRSRTVARGQSAKEPSMAAAAGTWELLPNTSGSNRSAWPAAATESTGTGMTVGPLCP